MNTLRPLAAMALILAGAQTTLPNAFSAQHAIRSIEARLGDLSATVRLRPYEKSDGSGWSGVDTSEPQVICTGVSIRIGKTTVPVPRSAYADLADVRSATLTRHGRTIKLTLAGADAGASFRCYIVVERREVVRRRVEDGEFPQNFYETTTYTNIAVRH